jgi:hypothetical protein
VPFVSPNLTAGQLGVMLAAVAAASPFALSGQPPLEHGILSWARFQSNPRTLGAEDAATVVGVKSVNGPLVRATSGPELRAVWELPAVNTRLAGVDVLEVLRERYAECLNAIGFPFQLLVRSTPVDTEQLLATLTESREPKTRRLADWLRPLLSERGLVERRRFLAVAAEDHSQLEDRIEAIEQGLSGLELVGRRLGIDENGQPTDELAQLVHSGWTNTPYRGDVGAHGMHIEAHALRSDDVWQSVVAVSNWPHAIDDDWLRRLVAGPLPLDVVWHVQPVDTVDAQKTLNSRLNKWHSTDKNVARSVAIEDAERLREALERGTERAWDVDLLVLGRGSSQAEARGLIRKATRLLAEHSAKAQELRWEQAAAVASAQPLADNRLLNRSRRIDTSSLARTYPFGGAELVLEGGIPIGETKEGARPVVWTPYRRPLLPNAHLLVIAPTGGGKGVLTKCVYARLYFAGVIQQIDVIDQDSEHEGGEYGRFAEFCDGQVNYLETPDDVDRFAGRPRRDVVVWNLANVPMAQRPEAFVRIKRYRWQASAGGRIRAALIVDEVWWLLRDPVSGIEVEDVIRKGRHIKLSGVFMTQRVTDCLRSDNGSVLLSQASSQWLGMMATAELTAVSGPLELSVAAQATIRRFRQGDGLMIAGPYQVAMRLIPTPDELAMAQTDYEDEDAFSDDQPALTLVDGRL